MVFVKRQRLTCILQELQASCVIGISWATRWLEADHFHLGKKFGLPIARSVLKDLRTIPTHVSVEDIEFRLKGERS